MQNIRCMHKYLSLWMDSLRSEYKIQGNIYMEIVARAYFLHFSVVESLKSLNFFLNIECLSLFSQGFGEAIVKVLAGAVARVESL